MNYTDIMLDIETLGTGPDAAILSIGAVAFQGTPTNSQLFMPPDEQTAIFHERVDLARTPDEQRGEINPSTVEWWMQQSDEARQSVVSGTRYPLDKVLLSFSAWIESMTCGPGCMLWSNGPTFDETIVRSAMRRCKVGFPISFRSSRCCRTLRDLAMSAGWNQHSVLRDDILPHNALHDAVYQAREVVLQRQFMLGFCK